MGAAVDAVRAKRVLFDTIEVLFAALSNFRILRSELRRFEWLKDNGVTATQMQNARLVLVGIHNGVSEALDEPD